MFSKISIAIATALVLTACASESSTQTSVEATPGEAIKVAGPLEPITVAGITVTGSLDSEPVIEIGSDAAPVTELGIGDQVLGTGDSVVPTSTVLAHYIGVGLTSGQKFDSSWDRGEPIQFGLDQVIPGWTQGLTGMQVGGRRVLVIPGDLAYGATPPAGSGIEPNETLIFVVDLIDFE